MADNPPLRATRNHILSRLSKADFGLLEPHLEAIELPLRLRLENPHKRIDHIYFIDDGFASVAAESAGDQSIEVGLIGREGMTGLAIVMGTDRAPHGTFMQLGGKGRRVATAELVRAMAQSSTLHRAFLNYGHAFYVQMAYTALANGRSKLEDRLARWLLMAHDRVDGDELALTHEFLSLTLGVRRPGVTVALGLLQNRGFIRAGRSVISLIDREGLEHSTNGAYGVPEAEFHRLFG